MGRSVFGVIAVILLFVVGCVGFFTLMAGGLFFASVDLTQPANGFFTELKNENREAARNQLSSQYAESLDFDSFVDQNNLDLVEAANWTIQTIQNEQGSLSGTIQLVSGKKIPISMDMVKEQGTWKIQSIEPNENSNETKMDQQPDQTPVAIASKSESPIPDELIPTNDEFFAEDTVDEPDSFENETDSEPLLEQVADDSMVQPAESSLDQIPEQNLPEQVVSTTTPEPTIIESGILTINDIPDDEQASKLAQQWTVEFFDGVNDNDFSTLHAKLAEEFQNRFSLEKFTNVFQDFMDQNLDFSDIHQLKPEFDRHPSINRDGILELAGSFSTTPRVVFNYSFAKNDGNWQPVAINLKLPTGNGNVSLPPIEQIERLVKKTTTAFGFAIADRDFATFYRTTYSKFQEKFTIQQFRDYFGSFIVNEADLSWLRGVEPSFDSPPSIDINGFMRVQGHFPADPRVNFRYAFVQEDSEWKLSTINLSIPPDENVNKETEKTRSTQ